MEGHWFRNAMFAKVPLIHGDKGSYITKGTGFNDVYPCKSKELHPEALMSFIYDVGIPQTIL